MSSARVGGLAALCLLAVSLVGCARWRTAARAGERAWEQRVTPAPLCRAELRLGAAPADGGAPIGTLVVRLVAFDSAALLPNAWVVLAPLAPLDSATQRAVRLEHPGGRAEPFVASVRPGRYLLTSRAFGFEARTDTVVVRAGATDTLRVALEEYADALRNRHECRPRGFRRPGERACVTDQITTVVVLDRVRDMATPSFRYGLGLPVGDSTDVRIVDDERLCERAARLYGMGRGPPRRVVLVQATNFYVAYDPAEPVALGELNQWLILDRRWRVLARLAL